MILSLIDFINLLNIGYIPGIFNPKKIDIRLALGCGTIFIISSFSIKWSKYIFDIFSTKSFLLPIEIISSFLISFFAIPLSLSSSFDNKD